MGDKVYYAGPVDNAAGLEHGDRGEVVGPAEDQDYENQIAILLESSGMIICIEHNDLRDEDDDATSGAGSQSSYNFGDDDEDYTNGSSKEDSSSEESDDDSSSEEDDDGSSAKADDEGGEEMPQASTTSDVYFPRLICRRPVLPPTSTSHV